MAVGEHFGRAFSSAVIAACVYVVGLRVLGTPVDLALVGTVPVVFATVWVVAYIDAKRAAAKRSES